MNHAPLAIKDLTTADLNQSVVVENADLFLSSTENPTFINLITEIFDGPIAFINRVNLDLSQFNNYLWENFSTLQIFNLAKIVFVVYKARANKLENIIQIENDLVFNFLFNITKLIEEERSSQNNSYLIFLYKGICEIAPYYLINESFPEKLFSDLGLNLKSIPTDQLPWIELSTKYINDQLDFYLNIYSNPYGLIDFIITKRNLRQILYKDISEKNGLNKLPNHPNKILSIIKSLIERCKPRIPSLEQYNLFDAIKALIAHGLANKNYIFSQPNLSEFDYIKRPDEFRTQHKDCIVEILNLALEVLPVGREKDYLIILNSLITAEILSREILLESNSYDFLIKISSNSRVASQSYLAKEILNQFNLSEL